MDSEDTFERADGRAPHELRAPRISWPKLARADGSARFAFGPTAALASLTGPYDVPPQREHPAHATLDVQSRPLSGHPGPSSRASAAALRTSLAAALELGRYPRTMISVVVQSLSAGAGGAGYGAAEAAGVNAASCAVLGAGSVAARGTLCAVAAARVRAGGALCLDPTPAEWSAAAARGWFAFLVTRDDDDDNEDGEEGEGEGGLSCRSVWSAWAGDGEDGVEEAREAAEGGARAVWRAIRSAVGETYAGREKARAAAPANTPQAPAAAGSEGSEESDSDEMEI